MIVEIPGEITFSRTYNIPPVSVPLPLTARARTFGQALITAIAWCFMMPALMLLVLQVVYLPSVFSHTDARPGGTLVLLGVLIFTLLGFMPKALFGMEDLTRAGPTLILDPDGVSDRRSGRTLRWTDVAAARIVWTNNGCGVRLTLRTPIAPRFLFDRGGTGLLGRRAPDQYSVEIGNLTVRPHVLGQTMLALVEANGGTVKR